MKESIKSIVKKRNWDNDVLRILNENEVKEGPLQFAYDRVINSLLEVVTELVTRVDEMQEELNKAEKKAKSKPAAEKVDR